jgi:transcription elongation GreA/GreB family factor
MDKAALRAAIIARLEADLALQTDAAHSSRAEATDQESKAEGQYDMRGQSAAYLAAGQAQMASEIADAIAAYRALPLAAFAAAAPVALGALVTVESGGSQTCYFMGPARGGLELDWNGGAVTVITAASALGRSLLGRRAGDRLALAKGGPAGPVIVAVA